MLLPFMIRIDHKSLKYMLDRRLGTPYYDEYKSGVENKVFDALSRVLKTQMSCIDITSVHSTLLNDLQTHWQQDIDP